MYFAVSKNFLMFFFAKSQLVIREDGFSGVFVDRGRQECFIPTPVVISTAPLTHVFKDLIPKEISKKSSKIV